jgi:hypothetical protein
MSVRQAEKFSDSRNPTMWASRVSQSLYTPTDWYELNETCDVWQNFSMCTRQRDFKLGM